MSPEIVGRKRAICFDWDGTVIDSMVDKFENFIDATLLSICGGLSSENTPLYRKAIDFCHKEYGGELRISQFDNVLDSLAHPRDLLRVLELLLNYPQELEHSEYLRERHLFENFHEEIDGRDSGEFSSWTKDLIVELGQYLNQESNPFPEFQSIGDRKQKFIIFDREYTRLNSQSATQWKPFPDTEEVLASLSHEFDFFIGSSLLNPMIDEEVMRYPGIHRLITHVYGGKKSDAIEKVKARGYGEICFVGDMPADRKVAEKSNVPFYRIHPGTESGTRDWRNLSDGLAEIFGN